MIAQKRGADVVLTPHKVPFVVEIAPSISGDPQDARLKLTFRTKNR